MNYQKGRRKIYATVILFLCAYHTHCLPAASYNNQYDEQKNNLTALDKNATTYKKSSAKGPFPNQTLQQIHKQFQNATNICMNFSSLKNMRANDSQVGFLNKIKFLVKQTLLKNLCISLLGDYTFILNQQQNTSLTSTQMITKISSRSAIASNAGTKPQDNLPSNPSTLVSTDAFDALFTLLDNSTSTLSNTNASVVDFISRLEDGVTLDATQMNDTELMNMMSNSNASGSTSMDSAFTTLNTFLSNISSSNMQQISANLTDNLSQSGNNITVPVGNANTLSSNISISNSLNRVSFNSQPVVQAVPMEGIINKPIETILTAPPIAPSPQTPPLPLVSSSGPTADQKPNLTTNSISMLSLSFLIGIITACVI